MTRLTRPVRRETSATAWSKGKHRPVIVTLEPNPHGDLLWFRLKGHRRSYALDVGACFVRAVEATIRAEKEARKQARRK